MAHEPNNPPSPANLPVVTYAPRPPRLRRPPFIFVAVGLVAIVASWVPLVIFARARTITSLEPRIQIMQDMGVQPKFSQQQSNALFADGRADRLPIPGTVARGHLEEDDHFYRGYVRSGGDRAKPEYTFYDAFPEQIKLDDALVERGRDRFYIYCSVCHGLDGRGHGQINERALTLMQLGTPGMNWTQAADLTSSAVTVRPVGHIYNTINVGIRSMPGYGAQITDPKDRWAIVAYVRALQMAQPGPAEAPAGSGAVTEASPTK
ncbi:MAG TPA: cytochrome c [Tepidisphaeraceae bacterium]|jgi:mono/diheme cytochrome c family protein|nr:cytochrome c [Tepidisphaeraceae bacterium]